MQVLVQHKKSVCHNRHEEQRSTWMRIWDTNLYVYMYVDGEQYPRDEEVGEITSGDENTADTLRIE